MTSLSDSQNIDLDPRSGGVHPDLPTGSPLQACPHCEALVDITEREPLEVVECPGCGQRFAVTGQIANYQIVDIAGKGGMGVVYKAYDAGLDRNIALKLLKKSQSNDAQLIQQLETEAAITASITDPNVVRVYGTGRDRGRFFIAMELVDKGSLDDLIHLQGRVAEAQVLEVGIQIASGLRAAYQHGLIHRDVKPGNILFADANTAKIVDFGLAIFMAQEQTSRGEIWGTPYYVAPEKLDQEPEDFRSDMYSLGGTLFHALAGRPPFEAENASLVALKHLKSQAVSLQAFAPWVSNPTAHIINRTLAKNPDDRFQSYDDLINNFGYALEQLQAHGNAPQQRARVVLETEEDRKGWTWVVLGMAAVIVVLLGAFFTMRPKGDGGSDLARANSANASGETVAEQGRFESLDKPITALVNREKTAVEEFRTALENTQLSPTDRAWAQYLEGVAALATNRTMDAKAAFAKVEPLASRIKDVALGKFLADSASRVAKGALVTPGDAADLNRGNHEALGFLVYGLHDWQLGQIEESVALLRQFRLVQPEGSHSWINSLKPLSASHVEEFTAFQMEMEQLKAATSPAQRVKLATALQNHSPALASRAEFVTKMFSKEIEEQRSQATRIPDEGIYRIINRKTGRGLDVAGHHGGQGGPLTQYDFYGQPNQIFDLTALASGSYRFRAIHAYTTLSVPNQSKDDGTQLSTWEDTGAASQQWAIEPQGDGWFKLKSKSSGKLISVQNQSTENAAKIVQMTDNGSLDQQWKFGYIGKKLTAGWYISNIGERHASDAAEFNQGVFKITDQGPDIWGNSDKATFVMRPVHDDFDLVTRVTRVDNTNAWTKGGLMVRTGTGSDRMYVALLIKQDGVIAHQRRPGVGAESTSVKTPVVILPHWLKIERRGMRFTTFHSADGKKWEEIASDTVKMHAHTLVGLALTSHDVETRATAEFDNLTHTQK